MTWMAEFVEVPEGLLGREINLGSVTVTPDMIASYARSVADEATLAGPVDEAPPTFCLAVRGGMIPEVSLPPDVFGVYGGHDLEFHRPIRAGHVYTVSARLADVYEKSGRSGALTVVVREVVIKDESGQAVARITERQILRRKPAQ
jgi:acyl dehydratase